MLSSGRRCPLCQFPPCPFLFRRNRFLPPLSPSCGVIGHAIEIARNWLRVIHSETVVMSMGAPRALSWESRELVLTRAQRAHWRLCWQQRLIRNARQNALPRLIVTLHGLTASFARSFGFELLSMA